MKIFINGLIFSSFLISCASAPVKTVHTMAPRSSTPPVVMNKPATGGKKIAKSITGQAPPVLVKAEPINPLQNEINSAKAYEVSEQWLKAANAYSEISQKSIAPSDQDAAKQKALALIEKKLSPADLESFADESDNNVLRGFAYLLLGKLQLIELKKSDAESSFESVLDVSPGTLWELEAKANLVDIKSLTSVAPTTIGAVLPLSGKNAAQGARALRGLTMGLGLHLGASNFKLAVVDSEGTPEAASKAVSRLVKEDNVIAIVGDIVSKSSESVAQKCSEFGVPVIALSQKSKITEIGPSVFRNALTSHQQIKYLVRSAMVDLEMNSFAIMYPNDPFGIEYANVFWEEVLARGGKITAVQTYNSTDKDFRLPVEKILGIYYGEARLAEYRSSLKELRLSDKKRSLRQSNSEVVLKPIIDFDAIFIPDDSKNFGQIAAMIAYYDVTEMKFLGTNLWNSPNLSKRTGIFGDNIYFADTYLDARKDSQSYKFLNEYKSLYNEDPSLIEVQAYDSALFLRQLIAGGAESREDVITKLMETSEFPGSAGLVKMGDNRELLRPLTLLTLTKGEVGPLKIIK